MFAFMGGDIVAVTAGEAKDPCRDIPPAARYMYKLPVVLYLLSSFLVGFNINYLEPQLWQCNMRVFQYCPGLLMQELFSPRIQLRKIFFFILLKHLPGLVFLGLIHEKKETLHSMSPVAPSSPSLRPAASISSATSSDGQTTATRHFPPFSSAQSLGF